MSPKKFRGIYSCRVRHPPGLFPSAEPRPAQAELRLLWAFAPPRIPRLAAPSQRKFSRAAERGLGERPEPVRAAAAAVFSMWAAALLVADAGRHCRSRGASTPPAVSLLPSLQHSRRGRGSRRGWSLRDCQRRFRQRRPGGPAALDASLRSRGRLAGVVLESGAPVSELRGPSFLIVCSGAGSVGAVRLRWAARRLLSDLRLSRSTARLRRLPGVSLLISTARRLPLVLRASVVPRKCPAASRGLRKLQIRTGRIANLANQPVPLPLAGGPEGERPEFRGQLTPAEPGRRLAGSCSAAEVFARPFVLPIIRKGAGRGGRQGSVAAG